MSQQHPPEAGEETQHPDDGQVSEGNALEPGTEGDPEAPGDATAGYPDSESGNADEGTAGPDAPPRHGRPEPSNESSR
jgi:hypothetical protein